MEYRNIEDLDKNFINSLYKSIGRNVAKYRKKNNLSQLELSQMLGYQSASQVASCEICYRNYHFNLEHLVKISYILNIDISTLLENNN